MLRKRSSRDSPHCPRRPSHFVSTLRIMQPGYRVISFIFAASTSLASMNTFPTILRFFVLILNANLLFAASAGWQKSRDTATYRKIRRFMAHSPKCSPSRNQPLRHSYPRLEGGSHDSSSDRLSSVPVDEIIRLRDQSVRLGPFDPSCVTLSHSATTQTVEFSISSAFGCRW